MARRQHGGSRRYPGRHAGPTRGRHAALEGTLRVARPGSAQVETPEGTFRIAPGGLREGMDGDVASVVLVPARGGQQAVVRSVMTRATERFVGTYGEAGPLGAVVPLDVRLKRDFFVLPSDSSPKRLGVAPDDVVVARILEYPSRREAGVVTLERRLGPETGLNVAIERIIASHGLATEFGERALAEASCVHADVGATLAAQPMREDLRGLCCVTVDPKDARDHDDAVSCARTAEGGFELWVHIADVTQYVGWGSSIDLEARERTCSAYLVDRVLPMLPEALSDDVCSLVPGEDRLAMSVRVELDCEGHVRDARACASAIRSRARLCYDEVDALLEGDELPEGSALAKAGAEVACALRALDELAHLRAKVRARRGAVDFASVEAKVMLDAKGVPTGVRVRRKTRATSLIEEAMLVANEVVAALLAPREELPSAFRVHEQPLAEALMATIPVLREYELLEPGDAEGICAGDPFALQRVLGRVAGTRHEHLVNMLLLRAQRRAVYHPRNDGHYALGADVYCHFTSPIRRYPDVCVHRALKRLLGIPVPEGAGYAEAGSAEPLAGDGDRASALVPAPAPRSMNNRAWKEVARLMPQLCRDCSEREREADAAAHESQKVKMAELMAEHVGESFSGIVVGCERYGLFVRLDETCAEGLVPLRALGEEWFAYDEGRMCLTGEATGACWRMGQRIAVEVAACSPAKGQIDLRLAGRRKDR